MSKITECFPRGHFYLADQLNRAATSIAANIAEGNGRYHKMDRANFFRISRGSAFECVPLLELAKRRNLLNGAQHEDLYERLEIISKMLSALVPKAVENN
ncbi:MAG: four helix bundle protein [Candidatus Omnitrophica bacterium]|nr:four helix bundle protein [Candidatus Omnitrophota bacterium]